MSPRRGAARAAAVAIAIVATLLALGASSATAETWHAPRCSAVRGSDFVSFSPDRGRTLVPTRRHPGGLTYTLGLVALSRPNALLAVSGGAVLRSDDAGCSWRRLGSLRTAKDGNPLWRLVAAPGGAAYAWYENDATIWRIEGGSLVALNTPSGEGLIGLGVDRAGRGAQRARLRAVDGAGVVWTALDGGRSWSRTAALPLGQDPLLYRAAFDPADADHIVLGLATAGAFVTFDGGVTWTSARGLSAAGGPVNVFEAAISPRDARIVWAQGIDLDQADAGEASQGRHVYRSADGGRTFSPVVDASRIVILRNGPVIAADPGDRDGVYFVFGTSYADYGTDLFRYDHRLGTVTRRHNSYDDFGALAFNPAAPNLVYVGIISERGIQ